MYETERPRVLKLAEKHYLEDLYLGYSDFPLKGSFFALPEGKIFYIDYIGSAFKNLIRSGKFEILEIWYVT